MPLWGSSSSKDKTESVATQDHDLERSASQNDAAASAAQAAGTEWLSGHLHHLTKEQENKLVEFKKLCEEKGYYKSAGDDAKPSHSDETMLRFLRARRFDVNGAWSQFKDTEEWRKDNAIEELYENIDVEAYDAARRMYPQWTGRRDRRGIPVYVFEIKHLNSKNMAAYNETLSAEATPETHKSSKVPQRLLRLFALYENLLRFVMPMCSQLPRPNPESPIVSSNNIVDVSGVGLKQFWNLKGHMQDASVLATAHYPETLDRIFIIGAPAFFPTVWGWIKRWFDPVTTSKIFILSSSEVKPTLTSFMDPENIPKQYGGDLDWKWGDMPYLDEPARELLHPLETPPAEGDTRPGFTKGPLLFKGDEIEILGKVDGKSRRSTIPVPKKTASTEASTEAQNGAPKAAPTEQNTNGADSAEASTSAAESGPEDVEKAAIANGDASTTAQQQTTTSA